MLLTIYFVLDIVELNCSTDTRNVSSTMLDVPGNVSSLSISIDEGNINVYNIIFLFINWNILFLGKNQMALLHPTNKCKRILQKINIQRASQLTPRKALFFNAVKMYK